MSEPQVTPPPRRERDGSIETLRGLACLLIVAYHSIPVGDALDSLVNYGYFGHCFRLIRLPLFTAISGYVYSMHIVRPGGYAQFVSGKARRVLLPWVTVTILTLVLKAVALKGTGLSVQGVLLALWHPIEHLWFLPAIFWVFLAVGLLEVTGRLATLRSWLVVCALAWLGEIFLLDAVPFLSVTGFFQLLPFFLFGLGLQRFGSTLFSARALAVYAIAAAVGMGIHQAMWFGLVKLSATEYNILVLVTVYGTQGLLFRFRRDVPPLASLGYWSFAIYLFHPISISVAVRVAAAARISQVDAVFALKVAFGLALPVLIALVLRRFGPLNLIVLGERSPRPRSVQPRPLAA